MSEACRALGVPVISGNVSFYNETEGRVDLSDADVGMVGVIPRPRAPAGVRSSDAAGDRVVLLGRDRSEFGGSAYLRLLHGIEQGRPPAVDLDAELRLAELLRWLVARGILRTAHDLSEGGLAGGPRRGLLRRTAWARRSRSPSKGPISSPRPRRGGDRGWRRRRSTRVLARPRRPACRRARSARSEATSSWSGRGGQRMRRRRATGLVDRSGARRCRRRWMARGPRPVRAGSG